MTTAFYPSLSELTNACDTLAPGLHSRANRPWCDESIDQSRARLLQITVHNFYGGRWHRLCAARRPRWTPQGWPQYVQHVAGCIETNYDLVVALQANDSQAWQAVHTHMHRVLRRHMATSSFGYLRRHWDGDDITQTACEKLIRVLPLYPWDVAFMAWLNSVAYHQVTDQMYKGRHIHDARVAWQIETTDHEWIDKPPPRSARCLTLDDPSPRVLHNIAWCEALATLPTDVQRIVFYRRRLCGWDIESVAASIQRSYTATASILLRADRNIRAFVEAHADLFRE
jgi:DNA-directed RNA polymerase specialized sigma24 family protein